MKKVTMDDSSDEIVGNLEVRHFIEQAFLNENLSAELRWQALLLVGIPGCGKSMIMRSSAVQVAKLIKKPVSLFFVRAGDLYREYYGQSERTPQILYEIAKKEAPSIIIIDEIDGMMSSRGTNGETEQSRRFKTSLLQEIQGVQPYSGVLTICSTNRAEDLDSAFVRRFSKIFCISLPNRNERRHILEKFLNMLNKSRPISLDQIDLDHLARITEGYTGDDLKKIIALVANANCKINVDGKVVNLKDIEQYRQKMESSRNPAMVVPIPVTTEHLVQAANEVHPSYKLKHLREMDKFKTENHIGSNQGTTQITTNETLKGDNDDYCCGLYKIFTPC